MVRTAIGAVILVFVGAGCGGGGDGGGSGNVCVSGMSVGCVCTNGTQGAQVCTSNGDGYGACMCSGGPGTAGTTGTAGTMGTGGTTGTAGTVGSAGTTGAAGSVATGGTGGSVGAAGRGGTGGSSGTGGVGAAGRGGSGGTTGTGGNVGNGGSTGNAGSSGYNGRWVSVTLTDAIIAPGKQDGTYWDDSTMVPTEVWRDLGTALAGGNPIGGVLAVLASPALNGALSSTAKPDPYGWVQATAFGVTGDSYWLADPDHNQMDTYTPVWPIQFQYTNVPIDSDVRIRVFILDYDLLNDDDAMPPAEINSNAIQAALAAQRKVYVQVDDQTAGDVLFIGISVVQQAGLLP